MAIDFWQPLLYTIYVIKKGRTKMTKTKMEKARFVKCTGEAHDNINIDNCWGCAPFWGWVAVCPVHNQKLRITDALCLSKKGRCPITGKLYSTSGSMDKK